MSEANYRQLFLCPEHEHYFLTHSIGLMPKSTEACFDSNFLSHWQSGSEDIWSHWLDGISQFKQALAALLGSDAKQFCPQSNVSSGLSKVLMALPKIPGRNVIVASESDFPSAGFVLQQAERLGYRLKLIPKEEDLQSLSSWEKVLSESVHTAFITQVHYNTNKLIPVEQIADMCRAKNIISIVDSAQATGIVPINLDASNIDIVLGSCIKWLCGGPGAGFLWLNENHIDTLEPYDVGWFSHKNPFEFDIHNFEYANSADRFWGGTPSVAAYIMASNSLRLINQIGIEKIVKHNQKLSQRLLNGVPEQSIVSPKGLSKKGGTVVLRLDAQFALETRMRNNNILFDSRQYGLRLSPHIYTVEDDIDRVIECISAHLA